MTMVTPTSLVFRVERREPELIAPAKQTPYEFKSLSDIDDQMALQNQIPNMLFYQNGLGIQGRDPARVIKRAISQALVYYYPFAGRLREGQNDKLIVECTGEGILFIEADAYVRLDQFGDVLQPPFPGTEDLLYNVPDSDGILHCPLLLIQVTRLMCRGFIVAYRLNHTMSDATGVFQFMTAVAEMACDASVPSIKPVWNRELLMARDPPKVTCVHHVYGEYHYNKGFAPKDMVYINDMVDRSFFFSLAEIDSLKNLVSPHPQMSSKFEILAACSWRCRTIALNFDSNDIVRFLCVVNARAKLNPTLPVGYYGNVLGFPVALTTVGELCQSPLGYALELVKKAKANVTDEFMKSTVHFLVMKGRPNYTNIRTYAISNTTHVGFKDIDFGWGKAVYGGDIKAEIDESFLQSSKNEKGEDGIYLLVSFPQPAMERFGLEIEKLIREANDMNSSSTVARL